MSWDLHNLFRWNAAGLQRFLRRRGHSTETAADLTQDTFVRVLSSPPAVEAPVQNPAGYLFRVARNLSIDYARRERLVTFADLAPDAFAAIVDPSPSPETIVYDRQRLKLTEQALGELPARTREAFELHRLGGMTIADVAGILRLSPSRTWTLIRQAYEHIDARLATDE